MLIKILLPIVCLGAPAASNRLRIQAGDDGLRVVVAAEMEKRDAARLSPGSVPRGEGLRHLRFALVREDASVAAPLFGSYRFADGRLYFTPRFRLVPGNRYRAELRSSTGKVELFHDAPKPKPTRPMVERIYPSGDVVPANHLKFYVHFSQPMREGSEIFRHFRLVDQHGKTIPDPWRHTQLWSSDGKRLTLWIHPGRVKEGVNLREQLGPVLEPNRRYRLIVDSTFRDASGERLAKPFEKAFRTAAADRARPIPSRWRVTAPAAGGRQPLRIEFGEPLDQPLLFRFLHVLDRRGKRLEGEIRVERHESVWLFTPKTPWADTEHRVRVIPLLEDLAGNTPKRIFDTDLKEETAQASALVLPFRPR